MSALLVARDWLWHNGLAVIPLVLIVAGLCRWLPCRPATRHSLWLVVLLWLVVPPVLPGLSLPDWLPDISNESQSPTAEGALSPTQSRYWSDLPPPTAAPSLSNLTLPPEPDLAAKPSRALERLCQPLPAWWRFEGLSDPAAPSAFLPSTIEHLPVMVPDLVRAVPADPDPFTGLVDCEAPVSVADTGDTPPAGGLPAWFPTDGWRRWLSGLAALRTALAYLAPLPSGVWLAGIMGLLALWVFQQAAFARRLRATVPASAATVRSVAAAAETMGLSRVPQTLMVRGYVPPSIWCMPLVGRARLLLPTTLWLQLDEAGRQAVLYHELAHLRRRDHWIRWVEMMVGALYWWHPVVWWVRHRLQEEAEYCCDAWVTWLMPGSRRAYAQALIEARRNGGRPYGAVPGAALAFTSRRTKRFARRITMVMTQNLRPRSSVAGMALALALAVVGWMAMPTWACPPKGEKKCADKCAKKCADKCDGKEAIRATIELAEPAAPASPLCSTSIAVAVPLPSADWPVPPEPTLVLPVPPDPPAVGQAVYLVAGPCGEKKAHLRCAGGGDEGDLEKRIERLEKMMQHLSQKLDSLAGHKMLPPPDRFPAPGKVPALKAPKKLGKDKMVRTYELHPEGKLKDMITLMSRQDVPVLIRPLDDAIEVHGSEAQHVIFKAFVDLIDPKKGQVAPEETAAEILRLQSEHACVPLSPEYLTAVPPELAGHLKKLLGEKAQQLKQQKAVCADEREAFREQERELKEQWRELERQRRALERQQRELEREARDRGASEEEPAVDPL